MPVDFTPAPLPSLPEQEIAARRAEEELLLREHETLSEIVILENAAGALLARLQTVRAATMMFANAGMTDAAFTELAQRIQDAELPLLERSVERERALMLRRNAIEGRRRALEELQQHVHHFASGLSRLASQLTADEHVLQVLEKIAPEAAGTGKLRPDGRRSQPRVRMQVNVAIEHDRYVSNGASQDISIGGVFVATSTPPRIGTRVKVRFQLPDIAEEIGTTGVVRWVRETNEKTPEIFPGAGIRFASLNEAAAGAIRAYVQTREPLFFPG